MGPTLLVPFCLTLSETLLPPCILCVAGDMADIPRHATFQLEDHDSMIEWN
jgi:hypothetical protein